MSQLPEIVIIVGPTASGKSALARMIAQLRPCEIISADSRQIYKHLTIGTAKPSPQDLLEIPHHFIDILEPDKKFNAGDFQQQGRKVITEVLGRNKLPLIVGGTGLYVKAIVDGFFDQPDISGESRIVLEQRLLDEGSEALFKELQNVDPAAAATMDPTKYRRVIRALEVYYETGTPISQFHRHQTIQLLYDPLFVGLQWERKMLYDRINKRVDNMLTEGFIDEVKHIQSMGFDDRFQSLQTVGYREAFAYLRNEIPKDRLVELMKQNTRRYAKRQLTWFHREDRIHWFPVTEEKELPAIADAVVHLLRKTEVSS